MIGESILELHETNATYESIQSYEYDQYQPITDAPEKPRWVLVGLQTNKSGNQETNAAVFDHCNVTNMQVWLNYSRYPSVGMPTDFVKEQYAGVYKSFYDFASRYCGIDNLLAGSAVNPNASK